jgi:sugar lactone lactonase YvrE
MTVAAVWLCAAASGAQTSPPAIVVSQTNWLGPFPTNGRALSAGNAAGTSFAVNSSGEILIGDASNSDVLMFNGQTGFMTNLGSFQNIGAVAVDNQDNLYVASRASGYIVRVPYTGGTYPAVIDPQQPGTKLPTCAGADTQDCEWGLNLYYGGDNFGFGVVSMTFDSAGDFFFATNAAEGGTSDPSFYPYSIFECSVASKCVPMANTDTGGGAPVRLFTEPAATSSSVSGCSSDPVQTVPGSLAVDPWGNLFFTDSALEACGSPDGLAYQSDASYLKEIAYSSSTKTYAAMPTTLYTDVPSSIASYDDELDAVAVNGNGTVYFATNYDGVFAFADTGTAFAGQVPDQDLYGVSTTGTRVLALDAKGNLYVVEGLPNGAPASDTIDTLGRVSVNNLMATATPVGTPATATNVSVMVNDGNCASSPAVTFAPSTEFTGAITGACVDSPMFYGTESSFAATLTFTPAKVGVRSAVLSATNATTKDSQAAMAFGIGEGGMVTLDPGNAPVAYGPFTNPAGIAVDAAGDMFVADAGANTVNFIPAGSTTASAIGSGFNGPTGVALDASGNLYVADTGNNQIVEIPNATGTPGAVSSVVSNSMTIAGLTLSGPTGLAMGADGVLYVADTGNSRVLTYNPANGLTGVRVNGLTKPGGIAVDAADTVYVTEAGSGSGGEVDVYPGGGGAATTLTPNGVTTPIGVAVEASGSVLISDGTTGAIVRVPNEGGTLNQADAVPIEIDPTSGGGLALDPAGNLYTTDVVGAKVYAYQRIGSTISFGSVNDGASSQKTVFAENSGNMPLALASRANSFLTRPSTANFAITAGQQNDCLAATSLDSGAGCEFTAEFSPALGTASGDLSDSAEFRSTAVNATALITLNGTAVYEAVPTPGFSIALGASSLNLKAGGSGAITVSVTPQNGFNSAVTFSCSGLPAGATCSFLPTTVTPSGGAAATTQLTVTVPSMSAALRRDSSPLLPGGAALACVICCLFGVRKRRALFTVVLLAVSVAGLGIVSGCGMHLNSRTTSTTSTVTVNALSGSLQSSATFTLTVQQ